MSAEHKTTQLRIAHYELRPVGSTFGGVPRRGCLVHDGRGYADLMPWPEFGNLPLEGQLEAIAAGKPTGMGRQTLACLKSDGDAREAGLSLFDGLEVPDSHLLGGEMLSHNPLELVATMNKEAWTTVRLHVGKDSSAEGRWLRAFDEAAASGSLRVRLDFGGMTSASGLDAYFDSFSEPSLDRIDLLIDPCLWSPHHWDSFQRRMGLRLALNRSADATSAEFEVLDPPPLGFETYIVRPALQDMDLLADRAHGQMKRLVVTTNYDHPFGQAWAAFEAARIAAEHPLLVDLCGLKSSSIYKPDAFSALIANDGPEWRSPGGTGLGFDELLAKLSWRKL